MNPTNEQIAKKFFPMHGHERDNCVYALTEATAPLQREIDLMYKRRCEDSEAYNKLEDIYVEQINQLQLRLAQSEKDNKALEEKVKELIGKNIRVVGTLYQMQKDAEQFENALSEAEKDKKRLDWLVENKACLMCILKHDKGVYWTTNFHEQEPDRFDTPRQAIDNAMEDRR